MRDGLEVGGVDSGVPAVHGSGAGLEYTQVQHRI